MPLYEMPAHSPYQKSFRPLAASVIVLLLIVLYISIWTPLSMGDEARKWLAWAAGALVIVAILASYWLSLKRGLWKSKQGLRIEISEGKLTQTRSGNLVAEIPLNQIASLHQGRGWLIVRGAHTDGEIAVPTNIVGFDELKREISAGHAIQPLRTRLPANFILGGICFIAACVFLFTSRNLVVLVAVACTALLIQGIATYSLVRRISANRGVTALLVASYLFEFLAVAWIVYERGFHR